VVADVESYSRSDFVTSILSELRYTEAKVDGESFCVGAGDIVGLLPTPGISPPRYRVAGWPEAQVMDALRAHAVSLD
jgi:hypothetical protein